MAVAAGWIRDAGGLAAAGLSTRMWLAVFGLISLADGLEGDSRRPGRSGPEAAGPAAVIRKPWR